MSTQRPAIRGARGAATRLIRAALAAVPALVWVAFGLVVAVVVAVAAAGGLRTAEATPAAVAMGTETKLSQYSVTVHDVEFTDTIEDQFMEAEAGETLVVATMTLENTSDLPVGMTSPADRVSAGFLTVREPLLSLSGTELTGSVRAWRADGSAGSVILQPGIPSTVKIAWTVPEDAVRSGGVHLDIYDAQVSSGQILISADQIFWRRGELTARIELGTS